MLNAQCWACAYPWSRYSRWMGVDHYHHIVCLNSNSISIIWMIHDNITSNSHMKNVHKILFAKVHSWKREHQINCGQIIIVDERSVPGPVPTSSENYTHNWIHPSKLLLWNWTEKGQNHFCTNDLTFFCHNIWIRIGCRAIAGGGELSTFYFVLFHITMHLVRLNGTVERSFTLLFPSMNNG